MQFFLSILRLSNCEIIYTRFLTFIWWRKTGMLISFVILVHPLDIGEDYISQVDQSLTGIIRTYIIIEDCKESSSFCELISLFVTENFLKTNLILFNPVGERYGKEISRNLNEIASKNEKKS